MYTYYSYVCIYYSYVCMCVYIYIPQIVYSTLKHPRETFCFGWWISPIVDRQIPHLVCYGSKLKFSSQFQDLQTTITHQSPYTRFNMKPTLRTIPSGKQPHSELENHHFLMVGKSSTNAPCLIANCNKLPEGIPLESIGQSSPNQSPNHRFPHDFVPTPSIG